MKRLTVLSILIFSAFVYAADDNDFNNTPNMPSGLIFLVPGQGIKEGLLIGGKGHTKDKWIEIHLKNKQELGGILYRTNTDQDIVAIQCRKSECATSDQGVKVGMSEGTVLRRYGLASKEINTAAGVYYEYAHLGVGFEIVNKAVAIIYVYARVPN